MHLLAQLRGTTKRATRRILPLPLRRLFAVWIHRQRWIPAREWWASELIRDWAQRDIEAYHRFLWSHHMNYAETYEAETRFAPQNIKQSRHMLFADLVRQLEQLSIKPKRDVRSVFEVGCSMGYLLRLMETDVFPAATVLDGVDIDEYAVNAGMNELRNLSSKVRLTHSGIDHPHDLLDGKSYDVILCAGVLMYLKQETAAQLVAVMLGHAGMLVALSGLAHPDTDNKLLSRSQQRPSDASFIHNFDAMVEQGGGQVVFRRWEGSRKVDGNTIYFVLCRKI